MSVSLVIIPTYNERENIERMIRKVLSLEDNFHVLVVDDGSPDGTGGTQPAAFERDGHQDAQKDAPSPATGNGGRGVRAAAGRVSRDATGDRGEAGGEGEAWLV